MGTNTTKVHPPKSRRELGMLRALVDAVERGHMTGPDAYYWAWRSGLATKLSEEHMYSFDREDVSRMIGAAIRASSVVLRPKVTTDEYTY